nr:glycoside hydrolase family 55 protein [Verrucomicrobiota bacterium]
MKTRQTWGCRRVIHLLIAALVLVSASPSYAWRSALYPADWTPPAGSVQFQTQQLIQDFSYAGYRRGEEPVPDVAGPVVDVTGPPYYADSTGSVDATSAIQNAINAVGSSGGGVVYLPAGTYRLSAPTASQALQITHSRVVLRGAGIGQTFLLNTTNAMRSKSILRATGPSGAAWSSGSFPSTPITADLPGPVTVIPVANPGLFAPGDWAVIRCDATNSWITEHNEPGWLDYGAQLGGIAYYRQVQAVDASAGTITVDIPTRYYLKQRDNARAHRVTTFPLQEIGFEDFSIGNVQRAGTTWGEED